MLRRSNNIQAILGSQAYRHMQHCHVTRLVVWSKHFVLSSSASLPNLPAQAALGLLVSAGPLDEQDTASQQSEDTPARRSEREQIRRDLLMGHLLSLATQNSPSGLPSHALPALAASLSGKGLMPNWVQWSLTHQPALFNKAFERLFTEVCDTVSTGSA